MSNEKWEVGVMVPSKTNVFWRYLGAAFTERKDGQQAISLTRTLAVVCFGYLSWKWLSGNSVEETLLWTFWALIGGKTAETMALKFRKGKG